MEELNEIKKQFDELMSKAEEIIKKNEEPKRWRAKKRKKNWLIGSGFGVLSNIEVLGDVDFRRWEAGKYFKTEEEAKKVAQHFKDYLTLRADARGFEAKDPDCCCFHVYWDYNTHEFNTIDDSSYRSGVIYFGTREDAEASIEKHGDIWKRYLGAEE